MRSFNPSIIGPRLAAAAILLLSCFYNLIASDVPKNISGTNAELVASTEPGWPQFRGIRRDGRSNERGLLQSWPTGGPQKLWSASDLGRGYSSPIIVNGRIYITGDVGEELHLFCLNASNGKLIWTAKSGAFGSIPILEREPLPHSARGEFTSKTHTAKSARSILQQAKSPG